MSPQTDTTTTEEPVVTEPTQASWPMLKEDLETWHDDLLTLVGWVPPFRSLVDWVKPLGELVEIASELKELVSYRTTLRSLAIESLAKSLYESYHSTGPTPWQSENGKLVLRWNELIDGSRDRWITVAKSVVTNL